MSLKEQITEDMKNAMRAKEAGKLGTIRLLLAEIKRKEVDERIELTDAHVTAIVEKMIQAAQGFDHPVRSGWPCRPGRHRKSRAGAPGGLHACRPVGRGSGGRSGCRRGCHGRRRSARHGQGHGHRQAEAGWSRRHDRGVRAGQESLDAGRVSNNSSKGCQSSRWQPLNRPHVDLAQPPATCGSIV